MSHPALLTSDEVRQRAVDAGLPPYAVAVIEGMVTPAGTIHHRFSVLPSKLYSATDADYVINYLRSSRFTQLIPSLLPAGVERGGFEGKGPRAVYWVARKPELSEAMQNLMLKLDKAGVDPHWATLNGTTMVSSEDDELVKFMEALDGYLEA